MAALLGSRVTSEESARPQNYMPRVIVYVLRWRLAVHVRGDAEVAPWRQRRHVSWHRVGA